jgi:sterol desaturase/sphingolipid hydroxylase (fatty acid hydroxylase superfamily)
MITWFYFSPALERCREFAFDWIAQIWVRNLIIMLVVAGGLHLYFYRFKQQADEGKYDHRDLALNSKVFYFNNQVLDNMFWTMISAVGFWTAYEVLMMWAYANGIAPTLNFGDNPAWFVFLIIAIPWYAGLHFYCQHRLLHIPFLYKLAHNWHHKNINIGPWSGAAMHPLEHSIWLSSVFIFLFIFTHPIHTIFILQYHMITAVTSHTGYEDLIVSKRVRFRLGDFFHQLHHRYFDCNYGTYETPWDQWLQTFHDGTQEGDAWIKQRRNKLLQQKAQT